MLQIESPGHINGKPPERPWVARCALDDDGSSMTMVFLKPMTDWSRARRAWSGNMYGVVYVFTLYDGHVYEVAQYVGKDFVRAFYRVHGQTLTPITQEEAWSHAG